MNIIDQYDNFVFDIWGVIRSGSMLIPGAVEIIQTIIDAGKKYAFLSNSTRSAAYTQREFSYMGLDVPEDSIMTSGQFFYDLVQSDNFNSKIYVITFGSNNTILHESGALITDSILDADYILILTGSQNEGDIKFYLPHFQLAIKKNIPMLCLNPDKIVYHDGEKFYCQGSFANLYQEMGGEVLYYGKPYIEIYQHLFKKAKFPLKRSVMIGDSLDTDIKGAINFGIDSILLLTGIHQYEDIHKTLKKYDFKPSHIINSLAELTQS